MNAKRNDLSFNKSEMVLDDLILVAEIAFGKSRGQVERLLYDLQTARGEDVHSAIKSTSAQILKAALHLEHASKMLYHLVETKTRDEIVIHK